MELESSLTCALNSWNSEIYRKYAIAEDATHIDTSTCSTSLNFKIVRNTGLQT